MIFWRVNLDKKFVVVILIALFIAEASLIVPANANYTLGELKPGSPRHQFDHDPHVLGPVCYVWPGAGWSYGGANLPGYQNIEVQGNYYSPWGGIVTGTTGDLLFGIDMASATMNLVITIFIPPEFKPPVDWASGDNSNIFTSLTNDYAFITTWKADEKDPYAPNWWAVEVSGFRAGPSEMIYIKARDMKAPTITGRYFFKVTLDFNTGTRIPVQNFPCLLVKDEADPAYISGTVRHAQSGSPVSLPGKVVAKGIANDPVTGKPTGREVTAIAYFNISANGYYELEGLAAGTYNITASCAGFPPVTLSNSIHVQRGQSIHGIDIQVNMGSVIMGTVNSKCAVGSLPWPDCNWLAGYLGKPTLATLDLPITVEVYDSTGKLLAFSPIDLSGISKSSYMTPILPVGFPTHTNGVGPATTWWVSASEASFTYRFGDLSSGYGAPMEYDGHVPQLNATWVSGFPGGTYIVKAFVNGYVQTEVCEVTVPSAEYVGAITGNIDLRKGSFFNIDVNFHDNPLPSPLVALGGPDPGRFVIVEAYDSANKLVGFNFTWVGQGSSSCRIVLNGLGMAGVDNNPTSNPKYRTRGLKFSLYRYRGIRDYGLPSGTYSLKVYVRGYAQPTPARASITLCAAPTTLGIHLVRGVGLNVTLGSVTWQDPPSPINWQFPGKKIRVYVYDQDGVSVGHVRYWDSTTWSWLEPRQQAGQSSWPWPSAGVPSKLFFDGSWYAEQWGPDSGWGANGVYGYGFMWGPEYYPTCLTTGSYTFIGYTVGYVQKILTRVWATLGASVGDMRLNLMAGAGINVIVNLRTEQMIWPTNQPLWARVRVFDAQGKLKAANITRIESGEKTCTLQVVGFSGYARPPSPLYPAPDYHFWYAEPGKGRRINPSISPDLEILPEKADNFYRDYGLDSGFYTVQLEVRNTQYPASSYPLPGLFLVSYYQPAKVSANIAAGGSATVVFDLHKMGLVEGIAYTANWMGEYRTTSWMRVEADSDGDIRSVAYTRDGHYEMYLPEGKYRMKVWLPITAEPYIGYVGRTLTLSVTPGGTSRIDFYLAESGIPIPEYPHAMKALVLALAILLCVFRWSRKSKRNVV